LTRKIVLPPLLGVRDALHLPGSASDHQAAGAGRETDGSTETEVSPEDLRDVQVDPYESDARGESYRMQARNTIAKSAANHKCRRMRVR